MQQGRPYEYGIPEEEKADSEHVGITTLEGTVIFPPVQLPPHILDVPPTPPPDPCNVMNCEFGSTCLILEDGLPRCSCTLNCTAHQLEPVCASDLKMYSSECAMNREACQRQVELRLRPLELCEGKTYDANLNKTPHKYCVQTIRVWMQNNLNIKLTYLHITYVILRLTYATITV